MSENRNARAGQSVGAPPNLSELERAKRALQQVAEALERADRRIGRWRVPQAQQHLGLLLKLKSFVEMARGDTRRALAATGELEAVSFKPKRIPVKDLPPFGLDQHVKLCGTARRRFNFKGNELSHLYVDSVQPAAGLVGIRIGRERPGERLGFFSPRTLEAADPE